MKSTMKILTLIVLITISNSIKAQAQETTKGDFAHVVFFWLKNPDDQEDRDKFETSLKKFIKSSNYIKSKHMGTPADRDRDVIDNTYTYCLIATFKDKADQDKYQACLPEGSSARRQEEQVHKVFIEESQDLWEKVVVYDSESIW